MSTKTKHRTSAEIEDLLLRPHCTWEMTRHRQAVALEIAIADARKELDFSLQSAFHAFDASLKTVASDLAERAAYPAGRRLAGLLAAKHVFDNCPELQAIRKTLDPLFAELEAAKAHEAEQARLASIAAQEKRIALDAAREKAIAEVEAQFA